MAAASGARLTLWTLLTLLTLWARRWGAVGASPKAPNPPNRLAMEGGTVSPIRAAG
jgi:hypothetical protein